MTRSLSAFLVCMTLFGVSLPVWATDTLMGTSESTASTPPAPVITPIPLPVGQPIPPNTVIAYPGLLTVQACQAITSACTAAGYQDGSSTKNLAGCVDAIASGETVDDISVQFTPHITRACKEQRSNDKPSAIVKPDPTTVERTP